MCLLCYLVLASLRLSFNFSVNCRLLEERDIALYCDLHGHSRKQNVFIYGCENRYDPLKRLRERVFPVMISKNAPSKVLWYMLCMLESFHLCSVFCEKPWDHEFLPIYDIPCADCSKSYVCETQRKCITRKGEHQWCAVDPKFFGGKNVTEAPCRYSTWRENGSFLHPK